MNQILLINPENVTEEEVNSYPVREAARAVIIDSNGNIALLHVKNEDYYKLPGGGLDGEDKIVGLKRECQEEVGCDVDVISEIGMITEYRKFCKLKQISYCYLAKVKGEKSSPNFTEEELKNGFEQLWLPYEEVKKLVALKTERTNFEGDAYIIPRDSAILEAVADSVK